ncbi:MAG: adenylate/guanylate cyclase domain-containing protein, partial [Chloroflexota bacterium]
MNASALLEKLAAFVPTPVVQAIYKHGFTPGEPMGQRLEAAVLFADISGFTALGELLSQAGVTGAEELTRLINTYFTRIIETIERYQGQVVKFSGDALTVIYTTDDIDLTSATHRASQCALEIQDVLEHIEVPETSQGPAPALSMKIGIGTGKILACSVGGELRRWEYVVAGDPLVQVATAQNKAHPKEVILSPQAWALTARFFVGKEDRSGFVRLVRSYDPLPLPVPIRFRWDTLNDADIPKAEDALKRYIPGAINARLDNQAEWLAELRRMNVLFIGLGGLDYEADDAVERLQALVQGVQKTIYEFEGALNKVAVDDKGTVLLILFGAPPFTHEDDAQRAVACALRLQEVAQQQGLRMSIGITEGSIFAGPVGAPTRQEYTVIGDQVNLAARLMQHGRRGTIIISQQVRDRVSNRFNVEDLGRIPIKGKSQALFAYQVLGEEGAQLQFLTRYFSKEDPLIGRKAELEQIRRMASRTKNGELQVLLIEGELGLGKSRLAAEMVREWMNDSGAAYGSTCSSYSHQMPYQCWQRIFSAMYGLTPDLPTERQLARLAGAVANLEDPADQPGYWADRLPLLQEIMGINIPETAFTESISGELRRDNTFVLIEMLLRQQAMNQPLLILLEDIHWADELSLALAAHLVQTLSDSPVFLVLAHRPMATLVPSLITIRQQSQTELIYLEPLSGQDSLTMANGILGGKPLPEGAIALLLNRAQGNPFFIQEIAQTIIGLLDQPTDQSNRISEALDLPGTVQDAILTRIDKLPDQEKLTLKIASVIGASFERTLL